MTKRKYSNILHPQTIIACAKSLSGKNTFKMSSDSVASIDTHLIILADKCSTHLNMTALEFIRVSTVDDCHVTNGVDMVTRHDSPHLSN